MVTGSNIKVFALLSIFVFLTKAENCPRRKVVVCYWASWSIYRPSPGAHEIKKIIPEYCTHIIYSFAGINLDGDIDSLDSHSDITKGGFKAVKQIKENNPCVKILLAIGGWSEGSEKYSLVAETVESREKFSRKALQFLIYYGFDGLDVDWEYPTSRGGLSADRENFVGLLKVLKSKLQPRNRLLTAAVPASLYMTKQAYDVQQICETLDFVSLMGYDMHQSNATSTHAPLRAEKEESNTRDTVDKVVQYYKANGCPSNKIILGIPAYGRTYTLKSKRANKIGASVLGVGKAGPYTQEPGFLGYNEICEMQKKESGWKTTYLNKSASVYTFKNDVWISYDDPKTVTQKAQYALDEGLGGVMFWSVDTDDFRGFCLQKSYPLLVAANKGLQNII